MGKGWAVLVSVVSVACGGGDGGGETSEGAPPDPAGEVAASTDDGDPDAHADPNAAAPVIADDTPPATRAELTTRFAPHLFLHPDETNMPANVDWYLARVTMRYDHSGCPDHEVLGLGKVTQASLASPTHPDDKSLCRHDDGDVRHATTSENFFLRIEDEKTYAGAPRSEWKVYTVWRPQAGGLVNVEYWFFYAYNDGFSIFNHESDWEHAVVTIDPKAERVAQVFLSAHKGGTTLKAGAFETDGTHPVAYVAKGTHANYPKPGSYDIPGTVVAKDDAKKGAPWLVESSMVDVGTRAAPKNGQAFVKFWGKLGKLCPLPETNVVTRHFP